jgi:hypothetical protein
VSSVLRIVKIIFAVLLVIVAVVLAGSYLVSDHYWGVSEPQSCANCHLLQSYVDSIQDPNLLVSLHADHGLQCSDCHDRTREQRFQETVSYLRRDYQDPIPPLRVNKEACFACHEHASYDEIALRTTDLGITDARAGNEPANPHQSHFPNLECSVCHRMHQDSRDYCAQCHTFGWVVP